MRVIYAWIALLLIVIAGVGLYIWQTYHIPIAKTEKEFSKMQSKYVLKFEEKAKILSDSAMIMAEQLKAIQGSLTHEQELKIKTLMDEAEKLKATAAKLKNRFKWN